MKTFRFDDVSINSDIRETNDIARWLNKNFECKIIFAVSPMVHSGVGERVFPKMLNAYSDFKKFYQPDKAEVPKGLAPFAHIATHGLIHCDHRLMSKDAQELSIISSASITNARIFVPPFNKWNADTEVICRDNYIELIKFEDGWLSMEENKYIDTHERWYLHARDWDLKKLKEWFK